MRFSQAFLDEIRERLPISQVVGQRVTWDSRKSVPAKGDYWACCPFHNEKTPSFHVDDRRGRYYCFGCGASGDHFRFLVDGSGLNFPESVERLAQEAGVTMPIADPRQAEREDRRAKQLDVMEMAAAFFQAKLNEPVGMRARDYLIDRGLTSEVCDRFRIGFAPPSRNALKDHLAGKGVSQEQMVETGLLISGDDIPVSFDRFRDRIMFPISDQRGRVIAFGGRALSPDVPAKYLNSPETPLFHKRTVLYNARTARQSAHERGTVIVVEGYMDVIACARAGMDNAVAPLGTALTEEQVSQLWRWIDEPILCFDGDAAGQRAAHRAVDLALPLIKPGKTLRFVFLPEGTDPDDIIRDQGAASFFDFLDDARPMFDVIWGRETEAGVFETPERRAGLEARFGDIVRAIPDEAVRRHYADLFRDRLREFFQPPQTARKSVYRSDGRRDGRHGDSKRPPVGATESLKAHPMTSRHIHNHVSQREAVLMGAVINHPDILAERLEAFMQIEFTARALDALRSAILDNIAENNSDSNSLRDRIRATGLVDIVDRIDRQLLNCREWYASAEAALPDALTAWDQAFALHNRARTLNKELKAAEIALANDPSDENMARLLDIQNQLARAEGTEASIEGFGAPSGRIARGI